MARLSDYPPEWPAVARAVKDAAGWRCVRCGHDHDPPAGYCLTVHHLDGVKANLAWWNLSALCQRCHLHIQGKVQMRRVWMFAHSEWFRPHAAGFYARLYGLPDSRPYVLNHADALIEVGQGRRAPSTLPLAA